MHPILARLERLAVYLGTWLAGTLLISMLLVGQGAEAVDAYLLVVPTFLAYAFVCLSAWYVCQALPATSAGLSAVLAASVAASVSGGVLWLGLSVAWRAVLTVLAPANKDLPSLRGQEPFLFAVAVVLYLLSLAVYHVLLAYDAAREAEAQRLEFQVLTREAELRALRAQLNPHFLYNSLNSISALTSSDPAGARRMCVLLGDFLRSTLKVSALDRVTLLQELSLVDAFLAIEQVRFGDRLAVSRTIDETATACRVPPLVLQPLVENAIQHGIAGLIEGGTITLTASRQGSRLSVRVENPRDPDVPPRHRGGVGLENVRRRVQTAFADRGHVEAVADAHAFRVELNLPAEEE
ncbi:MAG: sensor histidine kinase [Vicinamibacterales bacterium]